MGTLDKRVRSRNKSVLKNKWRLLRLFVTLNGDSNTHKKKPDLVRYYCEKKNLYTPDHNFEIWLLNTDLDIDEPSKKPNKEKRIKPVVIRVKHEFYDSKKWQSLRRKTLRFYGIKCMKCGIDKTEMHVDHIKPRSKYPELELDFNNLQVLCKSCNKEKSNLNEIDYRPINKTNLK